MSEISAKVRSLLDQAVAEDVRFIKLGRGGEWWPLAKSTNSIRIGFREFDFGLCYSRDWEKAKEAFAATRVRKRPADITRAANQVRDFFELPKTALWFTIEKGDVWWGFAEPEVINLYSGDDIEERVAGARMRRLVETWRNIDVNGEPLRLDSLTTKITKIASFQETIGKPSGAVDLLRRIRGVHSEAYTLTLKAKNDLVAAIGSLLDQLHQNDFELLIELIFSSSGWKRITALGGNQKLLDLALILPTTGEHCFVQVKSETNYQTFQELVRALDDTPGYSRMFFVYHTPAQAFENIAKDRVTVWHREEIARQVVSAGLVSWMLSRTT